MSGGGREARGERLMGKGGPKFKFKELKVWQKGKDLAVYIYQITNIKYALKFKIDFGTARSKTFCPWPLALSLPPSPKDNIQSIQN